MSSLFTKNQQKQTVSQVQELETRYKSAKNNLFILCVFSVINLIMLVLKMDTYFLFSATIPYLLAATAMYMCGMYPQEYYGEEFATMEFLPSEVFIVTMIIAVVAITLYLIFGILSSKHRVGWLIAALVMFSIDTLVMFLYYGIDLSMIVDIIFHIWIMVILVKGISAHYRLKNLPPEEVQAEENSEQGVEQQTEENFGVVSDSNVIRMADFGIKSKVLAEANEFGYQIIYRRVGKINELVINGRVYDEYVALVEFDHTLTANVGGHTFTAGLEGFNSFISVDGNRVAKKVRVI